MNDIKVCPLEKIELPKAMDGHDGSNRNLVSKAQISVSNDLEAIKSWLSNSTDNESTYSSYRKEAERLLLWAVITMKKPLSSLNHGDFLEYEKFLLDPQPESTWIMPDDWKYARNHKLWRPFAMPLSKSSQKQAMSILNTMMSWLVRSGYLIGNPLALSKSKRKHVQHEVTRFLDDDLWAHVKKTIMCMPQESDRDRKKFYRARWLFTLLFLGGLRVSEVVNNTMGCFKCRRASDDSDEWWLEIVGKGGKIRKVPVSDELLSEMMRYRAENGLSTMPYQGDDTPLLLAVRDDAGYEKKSVTRNTIHVIVKSVFNMAACNIELMGHDLHGKAISLRQASAHWIRHTAASNMAKSMDLIFVRDNLGHANVTTTNRYLHAHDEDRYKKTTSAHKMKW